jgi:Putative peptidoglycan binding domain
MNTKSFLTCFTIVMLATSMATAGTHHGNFAPTQGGFVRGGTGVWRGGNWNGHWNGGNWNGGNWGGNWHHHHHGNDDFNNFVFVGSFGFPFFGYPYGYGYYPYGYGYAPYGYGYGSGYYGYAPGYGYGSGYYGYGAGYYGNGYSGAGYYGNGYYRSSYYRGYGYNGNRSRVVRLQQQLARAGYYRGAIDGIMGTRTRYALRAYQHDHGTAGL